MALLAGFDVRAVAPQGDKVTRRRWRPGGSGQCEDGAGRGTIASCARCMRSRRAHDDEVDAASGAFGELVRVVRQQGTQQG